MLRCCAISKQDVQASVTYLGNEPIHESLPPPSGRKPRSYGDGRVRPCPKSTRASVFVAIIFKTDSGNAEQTSASLDMSTYKIHAHTHIHIQVNLHMRTYIHTFACTCACAYAYTRTRTHTYIKHSFSLVHTYSHIDTHEQEPKCIHQVPSSRVNNRDNLPSSLSATSATSALGQMIGRHLWGESVSMNDRPSPKLRHACYSTKQAKSSTKRFLALKVVPALMQLCPEIEARHADGLGYVFKRASENRWRWVLAGRVVYLVAPQ